MTRDLSDLMAPDWAEALAPVADDITAAGQFLREEIAAGRSYLPAGDRILRAFAEPMADVRVLITGQDPYPDAGPPGRAVVLGRAGTSARCRAASSTSSRSWRPTSASRRARTAT